MDKKSGKKWPWIISTSVVLVIIACVVTIKFALKNPDEPSDYGMQDYHLYDQNANDIIEAKIKFDHSFTLSCTAKPLSQEGWALQYTITDKNGSAINNAKVSVVLTRPHTVKQNISLDNPQVTNGIYTFKSVDLPSPGRWDILAKVSIDGTQRYYNLKADTRNEYREEF